MTEFYVALDVSQQDRALSLCRELKDVVDGFKVGMEYFSRYGPQGVRRLCDEGYAIFLDLKLYDIPRTVYRAVYTLMDLPIHYLTLHASGGKAMLEASRRGLSDGCAHYGVCGPSLLGVSALTSLSDEDLDEVGFRFGALDLVKNLGFLTHQAGLDGIVCSGHEVNVMRQVCGDSIKLVTPGIRLKSEMDTQDQKRVVTPRMARDMGSDMIVMGRSILDNNDPISVCLQVRFDLSYPSI